MEMLAGDVEPPSGSYTTRSTSRRRWARRDTSRSTAPSSLASSWSRAGTTMRPELGRRGTPSTAIRPEGADALLLARRGETEEAVALAREALASMAERQHHSVRGSSGRVAEVLRAHGDLAGAADSLAAAVVLHDEKGNVLAARRRAGFSRQSQQANRRRGLGDRAPERRTKRSTIRPPDQALSTISTGW